MKERVSWTIDEELIQKVMEEAEKENRSISFIVNEILNKYFKKK